MFSSPFGDHLVFKGGTSLSKAYGAIRRFSEDVDLTYDMRKIAGDLTGIGLHPLPKSNSQEKKWTSTIRERLTKWVASTVLGEVERALLAEQLPAKAQVAPDSAHSILVSYESVSDGSSYVAPVVLLEFGARSTGEPSAVMPVKCDAAACLPGLAFPTASPRVMRVERTFWEKATAIHVACSGGRARWERFSRHWYDIVQLDKAGHVKTALADHSLAVEVATHKSAFFPEKASGKPISYREAVSGGLRLVPTGEILAELHKDYDQMVADGLFLDEAELFQVLMARCSDIERRANAAVGA
jgi:hypothetical protein